MFTFRPALRHIFYLALALRLIGIGQSLWLDEAITWKASQLTMFQLLGQFAPSDFHPPLYYILIKFFTLIFGTSELALRIPSVIASLIAAFGVYRCAQIIDGKAGKWATAFFVFNPLVLYYSQEARMYMTNLALLCWLTYYFLLLYKKVYQHPQVDFHLDANITQKLEKEVSFVRLELKHFVQNPIGAAKHYLFGHKINEVTLEKHPLIMFNVLAFLAIFIFYGSIFYIFSLIAIFFARFSAHKSKFLLIGVGIAFLVLTPLLLSQLQTSALLRELVPHWDKVLGKANVRQLLLIPIKLVTGRLSYANKIAYFLSALVVASMVLGSLFSSWRKNQLWIAQMVLILTWGFLTSLFFPMLTYTRFLFLIIPLSLALAEEKLYFLKVTILLIFLFASSLYLFDNNQHREDWKSLATSLPPRAALAMIATSSDPVTYYRPDVKIYDLLTIEKQKNLPPELIVAPYVADIYNFPYMSALGKSGYYLLSKKSFHLLQLEYYSTTPVSKK